MLTACVLGGVVLQDGRSAYCCVCDDAGFWVRGGVCLVDLLGGECTFIMSTIRAAIGASESVSS